MLLLSKFTTSRSKSVCRIRFLTVVLAIVTVASVILLPASFSVSAQVTRPSEAELKAAFVYNFMQFTEWLETINPRYVFISPTIDQT